MSEISVVVVGSTTINSTVGNGDSVTVNVGDQTVGGGTGQAASVQVGSVTTLAATESASVVNAGTAYAAKLNFGIPRGPSGPANTLSIGTVSTGSSAVVSISGTSPSQTISFVLPVPVTSVAGRTGAVTITASDVSGLAAVATSGSYASLTGIPTTFTPSAHTQNASTISDFATEAAKYGPVTSVNGQTGAVTVASLSDATPAALGTASAGTSTNASRSDHVHLLPTISYTSLTNVPTTFDPATHVHSAADVTSGTLASSRLPVATSTAAGAVLLSNSAPSAPGTSSAGTSTSVSRADHVHSFPTISYTALTNVPTSFTPASHTQTAITISDFAAEAAKYGPVTTVAGRTGAVTIAASDVSGLAAVATSGSYSSLTGIPTTFTPSIATKSAVGGISVGGGLTVTAGGVLSVEVAPGAPTSVTDGGGTLSWTASTTGTSAAYDVQQTYDSGATYTTYVSGVTGTSTGNFDSSRKFRVRAKNAAGLYGPWGYQSGLTPQTEAKNLTIGSGFSTTDGTLTVSGGGGGASLSDASPQPLGTASAGTSTNASRSDHVHLLPTISYTSLTNVPTSFTPATHTHSATEISSGTLDAARLPTISYTSLTNVPTSFTPASHTQAASTISDLTAVANVISVNGMTGAVTIATGGTGGSSYTLPNATSTSLGGVVVGSGLSVSSGTLSVNVTSVAGRTGAVTISAADVSGLTAVANVVSVNGMTGAVTIATGGTGGSSYTLPNATPTSVGGVSVGSGLSVSSGALSANVTSVAGRTGAVTIAAADVSDLTAVANVISVNGMTGAVTITSAGSYTLPNATTTSAGGVVVGSGLSVSSGTLSANVTSVQGRTGAVTVAATDLTAVTTVTTGITGATAVTNLMALSASAYSAITTKHTATLYIISG